MNNFLYLLENMYQRFSIYADVNQNEGVIMKKIAFLTLAVMFAGCSQLSQFTSASNGADNGSVRAKMQSCMLSEAQSRFQAGTLFNSSISATADDLVATCTKKLALQSLGISNESKTAAENIITNLKNLSSAQ